MQIDNYRGDWTELAAFINDVWSQSYADRMTWPLRTPDYLEWQLGPDTSRSRLLAAYDGERLAGVLAGFGTRIRFDGQSLPAAQWSWLSVHPDYRGQRIAPALDAERQRRERERGTELIVSFRYTGSRVSQAERPNSQTPGKQFARRTGLWARVLAPDRFAAWHFNRWEGRLARWTRGLSPRIPSALPAGLRAYQPTDLAACVRIVADATAHCVLATEWTPEHLARQLSGATVANTIVAVENGEPAGLINFHIQPYSARTIAPIGMIDLLACRTTASTSLYRVLVSAALGELRKAGAILALKLRAGDVPSWPLIRNGFVPQPRDSHLVLHWLNAPAPLPTLPVSAPLHLLWR
jgi:GNAT superfamily N-acetyltransferase